ncbi:MAG TPA: hypothetical protein VM283_01390, partial [Armatimonadota bacterium]|nr:hypothetical protein [Armatimonadota bacterium]
GSAIAAGVLNAADARARREAAWCAAFAEETPPGLEALVTDADVEVRRTALAALLHSGNVTAVAALARELTAQPEWEPGALRDVLTGLVYAGALPEEALPRFQTEWPEITDGLARWAHEKEFKPAFIAVASRQPDAVQWLAVPLDHRDMSCAQQAFRALFTLDGAEQAALDHLLEALDADDWQNEDRFVRAGLNALNESLSEDQSLRARLATERLTTALGAALPDSRLGTALAMVDAVRGLHLRSEAIEAGLATVANVSGLNSWRAADGSSRYPRAEALKTLTALEAISLPAVEALIDGLTDYNEETFEAVVERVMGFPADSPLRAHVVGYGLIYGNRRLTEEQRAELLGALKALAAATPGPDLLVAPADGAAWLMIVADYPFAINRAGVKEAVEALSAEMVAAGRAQIKAWALEGGDGLPEHTRAAALQMLGEDQRQAAHDQLLAMGEDTELPSRVRGAALGALEVQAGDGPKLLALVRDASVTGAAVRAGVKALSHSEGEAREALEDGLLAVAIDPDIDYYGVRKYAFDALPAQASDERVAWALDVLRDQAIPLDVRLKLLQHVRKLQDTSDNWRAMREMVFPLLRELADGDGRTQEALRYALTSWWTGKEPEHAALASDPELTEYQQMTLRLAQVDRDRNLAGPRVRYGMGETTLGSAALPGDEQTALIEAIGLVRAIGNSL